MYITLNDTLSFAITPQYVSSCSSNHCRFETNTSKTIYCKGMHHANSYCAGTSLYSSQNIHNSTSSPPPPPVVPVCPPMQLKFLCQWLHIIQLDTWLIMVVCAQFNLFAISYVETTASYLLSVPCLFTLHVTIYQFSHLMKKTCYH